MKLALLLRPRGLSWLISVMRPPEFCSVGSCTYIRSCRGWASMEPKRSAMLYLLIRGTSVNIYYVRIVRLG